MGHWRVEWDTGGRSGTLEGGVGCWREEEDSLGKGWDIEVRCGQSRYEWDIGVRSGTD